MVRAKFTVNKVATNSYQPNAREITLSAVYDTATEENRRFTESTPSGEIRMFVTNPSAIEALPIGATFYVDFTPA